MMMTKLIPTMGVLTLLIATTSCGKISIAHPFGSGEANTASHYANATHYVCADKKYFYVRMQSNNQQAWLIYPDHEVGLNQSANDKSRYVSGVISLVLNGEQTTLNDGEKVAYSACQPQK